ncbi:flagellar basal body protein [Jatrophihabitans telluris]|uniref:Flagellar basal body protein n=1 Tax=Jatrophihabitans telluris TaxID=2038343 RepID=A0ABY4QWE4_9ACTN|nr:flagellar basal body rod C-terminal domain-containing protein [Jatrophihabitans telluris]UQX87949.1 flagellar basal body protein [Jatrophihabitans telluris]
MSLFSAINISGTGLSTFRTWIDSLANNIANVNTATSTSGPAFQATYTAATALPGAENGTGGGVQADTSLKSSATGRLTYQPDNPLADAQGYVRLPDIDMSEQMGNLIMAQRAFQANAAVIDRAKQTYQDAINIGKNR